MKKNYLVLTAVLLFGSTHAQAQVAEPTPAPAAGVAKSSRPATRPADPSPEASTTKPDPSTGGKGAPVLPKEKAQPVRLVRFDKPPTIDGKLDDEAWQHAVLLKDFYQVQPGDNIAPSQPTEVMLGFDPKFLYIAFHCYDDPTKVRANIPKRDQIFEDDYVGILLDTFNDQRKAYELSFNCILF